MNDETRNLAPWFLKWRDSNKLSDATLPAVELYGKGVSSLFESLLQFDGLPPNYSVNQIDKDLELYTLHEATNTGGISDLLENLLQSPLIPSSRTEINRILRTQINSGLVCYAQPKIDDEGNLLPHNISLQTEMPKAGASDIMVIVAKAGAKLNIEHNYIGGSKNSSLGRMVLIVCEDASMVKYKDNINEVEGSLYIEYISFVGPASNITFKNIVTANAMIHSHSSYYLLGDGSNCSADNVYFAKGESKFDTSCVSYVKAENTHTSIQSVGYSNDKSHLIYKGGMVGEVDDNSSVHEAKFLLVGNDSRVDLLPEKGSKNIGHLSESHVDSFDEVFLKQFFGRVSNDNLVEEAINYNK